MNKFKDPQGTKKLLRLSFVITVFFGALASLLYLDIYRPILPDLSTPYLSGILAVIALVPVLIAVATAIVLGFNFSVMKLSTVKDPSLAKVPSVTKEYSGAPLKRAKRVLFWSLGTFSACALFLLFWLWRIADRSGVSYFPSGYSPQARFFYYLLFPVTLAAIASLIFFIYRLYESKTHRG